MNSRKDADILVGYFALDGNFNQLVGMGLHLWGSKKWKSTSGK